VVSHSAEAVDSDDNHEEHSWVSLSLELHDEKALSSATLAIVDFARMGDDAHSS
jgi:hypothetical protein